MRDSPSLGEDHFMLYKTVSNLCYLFIVALCLSDVALVNAQTVAIIPCGPNHSIPPGYKECIDTGGRVWVAPPPGHGRGRTGVVVPPPGVGQRPNQTQTQTQSQPQPPEEHSVWFNIGVITAIAALIAGIAQLIRSLRKG